MPGTLSTFKYHQACASHPSAHTHDTQIEELITAQDSQELESPRLSSDSSLSVLTVDLDLIVATYKCAPPRFNLSTSVS